MTATGASMLDATAAGAPANIRHLTVRASLASWT